ncbi:MAG: spermine synthase [uncultured bacterium]|nr:MAG: spermine synthase [uncultured bacterium]HBH17793.1 hypothetical protein [Cyanobacteria bacterium UBA9579]
MIILSPDININKHFHPDDLKILENIEASEKVLFEIKTHFNKITVTQNQYGRFMKFDDSYQSGIINHSTYQGNLPYVNYFLLAPIFNQNIKNILILGMGTGKLATDFLKLIPALKSIDIVELDPKVVNIDETYFDFESNKKINIHIQDARVFVRNTKNKYDLVILDIYTGSGLPYRFMTEEFLQETDTVLNPDGLLITNTFGIQDINSDNNYIFKSLLKTYQSVFNNTVLFPTLYGNFQLYNTVFGLKYELTELTNIMIIAFNSKTLFKTVTDKTHKIQGLKNTDNYLKDLCEQEINVADYIQFSDKNEEELNHNLNNLDKYLKQVNPE